MTDTLLFCKTHFFNTMQNFSTYVESCFVFIAYFCKVDIIVSSIHKMKRYEETRFSVNYLKENNLGIKSMIPFRKIRFNLVDMIFLLNNKLVI